MPVDLTPRERQIADLLLQGGSNKEIAAELKISPRTVKNLIGKMFLRAGITHGTRRVRLAVLLFREGKQDVDV